MKNSIGIEQELMYHLVLRSRAYLVRQAGSEVLKTHTSEFRTGSPGDCHLKE